LCHCIVANHHLFQMSVLNAFFPRGRRVPAAADVDFVLDASEVLSFDGTRFNFDVVLGLRDGVGGGGRGEAIGEVVFSEENLEVISTTGVELVRNDTPVFRLPEDKIPTNFLDCYLRFRAKHLGALENLVLSIVDLRSSLAMKWRQKKQKKEQGPRSNRARCLVWPDLHVEVVLLDCILAAAGNASFSIESWVCCGCNEARFPTLRETAEHLRNACSVGDGIKTKADGNKCYVCGVLFDESRVLKEHAVSKHKVRSDR
jgi:hypothetical protein